MNLIVCGEVCCRRRELPRSASARLSEPCEHSHTQSMRGSALSIRVGGRHPHTPYGVGDSSSTRSRLCPIPPRLPGRKFHTSLARAVHGRRLRRGCSSDPGRVRPLAEHARCLLAVGRMGKHQRGPNLRGASLGRNVGSTLSMGACVDVRAAPRRRSPAAASSRPCCRRYWEDTNRSARDPGLVR